MEQTCSVEDLDGVLHQRGDVSGHTPPTADEEFTVPTGEVFLLSDNRLFPYDSRDFGTVPRHTCREAVFFRLWGLEGFQHPDTRFTYIQ